MWRAEFVLLSEALTLWDHLEAGIAKVTAVAACLPFQYHLSKCVMVEMDLHRRGKRGTRVYSHDQTFE